MRRGKLEVTDYATLARRDRQKDKRSPKNNIPKSFSVERNPKPWCDTHMVKMSNVYITNVTHNCMMFIEQKKVLRVYIKTNTKFRDGIETIKNVACVYLKSHF